MAVAIESGITQAPPSPDESALVPIYDAWTNQKVLKAFEAAYLRTILPNDAGILAIVGAYMMHLPNRQVNASAVAATTAAGIPCSDPDGNLHPMAIYNYPRTGTDGDSYNDMLAAMATTAQDAEIMTAATGAGGTAAGAELGAPSDDTQGTAGEGAEDRREQRFLQPPTTSLNENNYIVNCVVPATTAGDAARNVSQQQMQQHHHQQHMYERSESQKTGNGPVAVAYADWLRRILALNSYTTTEPVLHASIVATTEFIRVQTQVLKHAFCLPLPFHGDQAPGGEQQQPAGTARRPPKHPRPAETLVSAAASVQAADIQAAVEQLRAKCPTQDVQSDRNDIHVTRGLDFTVPTAYGDDGGDDGTRVVDADDIPNIASVIAALQAIARASASPDSTHGSGSEAMAGTGADREDFKTHVAQREYWYEVRVFADYLNVSWDDFRAVGLTCCQSVWGVLWMRVELWPSSGGAKHMPALCVGVPMVRYTNRPPRACPAEQPPSTDPHGEVNCMRCRTCLTNMHLYSRQIGMYADKPLHARTPPHGPIAKMLVPATGAQGKKSRPAPYATRRR